MGSTVPSDLWRQAKLVFVGFVERSSIEMKETEMGPVREQQVVLRVEEAFKGVKPGQTIEFRQLLICVPTIEDGKRVLLYLNRSFRSEGMSSPCGKPVAVESVPDDLLFLRALPGSARRSIISGAVTSAADLTTGEWFPDGRLAPAAGFRVIVRSAGRSLETKTNQDGVYQLYDLPPGAYSITISAPAHLSVSADGGIGGLLPHRQQREVKLGRNGAAKADFLLGPAKPNPASKQ